VSTSPPPPPPVPPGSGIPVAAWDRRSRAEQRRAAKHLARQQREMQRAQMRAARRNSVLGPVLLVSLGAAFLLLETGALAWAPTVFWFGRWWPLVLVGAGVVLLAEWAVDTFMAGHRSAGLPRRSIGAGGVILLLLLSVAGASALAVHTHSDSLLRAFDPDALDSWGLDGFFGQHKETQRDLSAALLAGQTLNIQNFRGNITVHGDSQDGQVHVSVRQHWTAWGNNDSSQADQLAPSLVSNGTGLLLRVPGEGRDRADLTIEVPHETALSIAPERGELAVSELRGAVTVEDHAGNIDLTGLTGHVHLIVHDDDATVTAHSLSGDLSLEGRSGDLALSDLTGPLVLHGDFFGTTHLERIGGPVHFQSSFTDLACAAIPGELNIEGRSELQGHDLGGPLVLSTTDRDVTLSAVRKGANINDRNGSVTLTASDLSGPVKVVTTDGSIDLSLPEKTPFALSAETADGQISNTLGLTSTQKENHTSLTGQVLQGGPSISLQTSEGDIKIRTLDKQHLLETAGAATSDQNKDDESGGPAVREHRSSRARSIR